MIVSFSSPLSNISIVGMLLILNLEAVAGFSSTFNLHTLILPEYSSASSSIIGPIILHGPHQGAQQSSRTGIGDFKTFVAKLSSVSLRIKSKSHSSKRIVSVFVK